METKKSYIESIHHLSVDVVEKYQQLLKTQIKCTLIMQSKSPFISVKKKVAAEMHIVAEKNIFNNLIYNLLDSSMFETHDFIIDIDEFQVRARQYGNKRKIKLNKFLGTLLRDFNEKRALCNILKNKKFVTINTQANAIYDMETTRKKFIAALITEWPCTEQAIDIKFQTHDYVILTFQEGKK